MKDIKVKVLRLGHRPGRDKRLTTHVGLVARAFGADEISLSKDDEKVKESIIDVTKRFGGNFKVEINDEWKQTMKNWKGDIYHLTMYGEKISSYEEKLKKRDKDVLIVLGAEKVPRIVYDLADYNISVTNQPHSEVAALAIFLDRLFDGKELNLDFDGEIKVIPQAEGKYIEKN
ncbi:MAG: SpoU rRNA Methylase family enzyme [Candidatus Methanohalarchaeum thermophilum]|uniref:tRNA (cytidine(56)-2'-O)-methyltransferase n=1 Tax=Methanohalarchaeum thermophilum TaxID=1903181 RepID=A0A1Q6DT99_METT1|nr:MAG: SpoU rRNA Methylase family enzyme [Candidatus Methanohalarchaeum thermophilum]